MHRGQDRETVPITFTKVDDSVSVDRLPQTARLTNEAAFQKRFGLALIASFGLHAVMFAFAPGIPTKATPAKSQVLKTFTVGLANLDTRPNPGISTDQQQRVAERVTSPEVPASPPPPIVQQIPQSTQNLSSEPAQVSFDSQKLPDSDMAAVDPPRPLSPFVDQSSQVVYDDKVPVTGNRDQPSGGDDKPPDTAKIGEEFKLAFMSLLAYPEAARRRGVQGTVGLRITMVADGRIVEVLVTQTSGSSILDRAAVAAAMATPGPLAGPGRRLELALRVSFKAGQVLARP
ncbi:MAG: TonB family protein [Spirochaetota bacterium]